MKMMNGKLSHKGIHLGRLIFFNFIHLRMSFYSFYWGAKLLLFFLFSKMNSQRLTIFLYLVHLAIVW